MELRRGTLQTFLVSPTSRLVNTIRITRRNQSLYPLMLYVINTGSHWVLIDTVAGELFGAASGRLISNMKASRIDPKQIDIVLLTHIHADHSGGLTVGGNMQFPNATIYVVHAAEVQFARPDVSVQYDVNPSEAVRSVFVS